MLWNKKLKLHLGCGSNLLAGWVNIDLDTPGADLHRDLTQPLPYKDQSVELIFTEHFIEHITRPQALALLIECKRVMTKDAVIRISTPDLRWLVTQYSQSRTDEWEDVQWLPKTPCQMLNEGMREWGHQFLYDLEELTSVLTDAGFSNISSLKHRFSEHAALCNLECRPWHHEVILEAQ